MIDIRSLSSCYIPFAKEKICIKAVLKGNIAISKEFTIWIKQKPDDEKLPSEEQMLKIKKKGK